MACPEGIRGHSLTSSPRLFVPYLTITKSVACPKTKFMGTPQVAVVGPLAFPIRLAYQPLFSFGVSNTSVSFFFFLFFSFFALWRFLVFPSLMTVACVTLSQ